MPVNSNMDVGDLSFHKEIGNQIAIRNIKQKYHNIKQKYQQKYMFTCPSPQDKENML